MQCTQCNEREAVIHLTQIANEQVQTLHLCEKCAAEKGVETSSNLGKTPIGSFLATMAVGEPGTEEAALPACSGCGATLMDFRELGRLGCPLCYRSFEEPLRELLRRLHGSSRHVGKRYRSSPEGAQVAMVEQDLREQLRLAIAAENFELAAELRDRLKVHEGNGGSGRTVG